jgi:hypothetical protein
MIASKSVVSDLSAYGTARATIAGAPLSDAEVQTMQTDREHPPGERL